MPIIYVNDRQKKNYFDYKWLSRQFKMILVLWFLLLFGKTSGKTSGLLTFPMIRKINNRRRLFADSVNVHRENDGVYYTDICLSDQCFTVIIDTSSSTTAIPCQDCDCGEHRQFNPSKSVTAVNTRQLYSQCYGEGSCNYGVFYNDFMCFGKNCRKETSVRHSFGCCSTYSPNFKVQKADGIIGMSPSGTTLWKDLVAHHKLDKNQIALCFGKSSGKLMVGGVDSSIPGENNLSASLNIQWTDMQLIHDYYEIQVLRVVIDKYTIDTHSVNPSTYFMVDSGSSFSYIQKPQWEILRGLINDAMPTFALNPQGSNKYDAKKTLGCYQITRAADLELFPDITFQIQQSNSTTPINMRISPDRYFFISVPDAKIYCIGILEDHLNVIGANLLSNFLIVLQEKHMGIARAECESTLAIIPDNWCLDVMEIVSVLSFCGVVVAFLLAYRVFQVFYKKKLYTNLATEEENEEENEEESEADIESKILSSKKSKN